jgi:hypothetical protein
VRDGLVRLLLTVIAAALVVLVLLEAGWLPRRDASPAAAEPPIGRYQYLPARYGPLGNFVFRFDTATGKLERVRFPANDVVWEEVGVLAAGKKPRPDPVRETPPQGPVSIPGGGITIGPGGVLIPTPEGPGQGQPGGAGTP